MQWLVPIDKVSSEFCVILCVILSAYGVERTNKMHKKAFQI